MPWTVDNPPSAVKNKSQAEIRACVAAANSVLRDGGTEEDAIQACLGAAGRVKDNSSALTPGGGTLMEKRIVDLFAAERVLAGEPVRLLPILEDGYWRWGQQQPPITPEVAAALADNFDKRGEQGLYQTNVPINTEHTDIAGKVGTIGQVITLPDGVYGTLDLTEEGRRLLEEDRFDYLSPEIYWEAEDTRTGEPIGPLLVGLALTNYPFFGDDTALFSTEAGEHFEASGPSLPKQIVEAVKEAVRSILTGDFSERAADGIAERLEEYAASLTEQTEGDMSDDKKTEGGAPDATLQVPEEFRAQMADMQGQIAKLTSALDEKGQEAEQFSQALADKEKQIDELTTARMRERFSHQVAGLTHIGAKKDDLVEQLMWLEQADTSEGQEHLSFWGEVLSSANLAAKASSAYEEVGQAGRPAMGDAFTQVNALVETYAAEKGVVAVPGTAQWAELQDQVIAQNPHLYSQHRNEVLAKPQ